MLAGEAKDLVSKVVRDNVQTRLIRPPGALAEPAFLAACSRCGECAATCPQEIVTMAAAQEGAAIGTPVVNLRKKPCISCGSCAASCPSGALQQGEEGGLGLAIIAKSKCLAFQGDFCQMCSMDCRGKAISFTSGYPRVATDKCTGCGTCEHLCPVAGAIRVSAKN
jgi:MauM/NapG family ferredoxin protein